MIPCKLLPMLATSFNDCNAVAGDTMKAICEYSFESVKQKL